MLLLSHMNGGRFLLGTMYFAKNQKHEIFDVIIENITENKAKLL